MLLFSRPVHPRGALMRRRDVGRGRRLRPGFTPNSGLGGLEAGSGFRASGGSVRDPTAPYYGGAAPWGARVGARDTAGRVGFLAGRKARLEGAVGRDREPQEVRKASGAQNRRTFRSDPDAGSKGPGRKDRAGANRGDAERLLKTTYESFGVPRPSTSAIAELGPTGPRGRSRMREASGPFRLARRARIIHDTGSG